MANPSAAYAIAAWCSWLVPLGLFEIADRRFVRRRARADRLSPRPSLDY